MQRLAQESPLIENRLTLEDSVRGTAIQQHALPQAVQLYVHDLRDEPAFGCRRQRALQSPQLRVLPLERLEAHAAQLDGTLLGAQAIVFAPQYVAGLEALLHPGPGRGRRADGELQRV